MAIIAKNIISGSPQSGAQRDFGFAVDEAPTAYTTTTLSTGTWVDLTATGVLVPTLNHITAGLEYTSSGGFKNISSQSKTYDISVAFSGVSSSTAFTMGFTVGIWNGSTFVADESVDANLSIDAVGTTIAGAMFYYEAPNITLAPDGIFGFMCKRAASSNNLRTFQCAVAIAEVDA